MSWDKYLDFTAHLRRFQAEESSTALQMQIASKARPVLLMLYHKLVNDVTEARCCLSIQFKCFTIPSINLFTDFGSRNLSLPLDN